MKKKILAIVLTFSMLITGINLSDKVQADVTSEYLATGECGDNITWTLSYSGQLVLNGTGVIELTEITWSDYKDDIKSLVIGEGITEVGIMTFENMRNLKEVSFPDTLTVIGEAAFKKSALDTVEFPDSLKEIGNEAFREAVSPSSYGGYILLPEGLEKIGDRTFLGCRKEFISVPDSVTEIGCYAFIENQSIHCEKGSYAEKYAIENEVPYKIVEQAGKKEVKEPKYFYNCEITLEAEEYYYDGNEKRPAVTITDGKYTLIQDVDYTVSYECNIEVGTAVAKIVGIGEYEGEFNKTNRIFNIIAKHPASSVEKPTGKPEPENVEYLEGTKIPSHITLYVLQDAYQSYLVMPENFMSGYQLDLSDATVSVVSGNSVTVNNSGYISPKATTMYWNGNVGTTWGNADTADKVTTSYDFGETMLRLKKGNQTYDICVNLVEYGRYYAEHIMKLYLEQNIDASMSDYEKLEVICAFVAAYDYSVKRSDYPGLIVAEGGDCWASTNAIIYMCKLIGLEAYVRIAINDLGAGTGHRNVAVMIGGETYIAEAGYAQKAPRPYFIKKTVQGWSYSVESEDTVSLTQYDGLEQDVIVPLEINSKRVTAIDDRAISYGINYNKIASITIPESVQKIGQDLFYWCGKLKEIKVDVENQYFSSQDGVLFDKVQEWLIAYPPGKSGEYMIPSTVKTVGLSAMNSIDGLTSVIVPESVKVLEGGAFQNCINLKAVYFCGNAPEFGENVFGNLVATVYYPKDNPTWSEIINENYGGRITWKAYNPEELLIDPINNQSYIGKSIEPPVVVQSMGKVLQEGTDYTVNYSDNINVGTAVVTVTGIGMYSGTYSVEFQITPKSLENIYVEDIASQKYTGKELTPLPIVKDDNQVLEKEKDYTITYADNINSGEATLTIIGTGNYSGKLTKTFQIYQEGSSEESGEKTDSEVIRKGTCIKIGIYEYKIIGNSEASLKKVLNKNQKNVTVPQTIKYKGRTFRITGILASAFKNTKIASVIVGNNVKTIGKSAFQGCTKLKKVTIGSGVTQIENNAFKDCKSLKTIKVKSTKIKKIGNNAFKGIKANAVMKVPKKKLAAYKKLFKNKGLGKKVKITK